jgi:hypothetical protein
MKTRKSFIVAALVATLAGCTTQHVYPTVPTVRLPRADERLSLTGKYYQGDGLGWNLYLTLSPTGGYEIAETGCLGEYGRAHGNWTLYDNTLMLHEAGDADKDFIYPRFYEVLVHGNDPVFLSDITRSYFRDYGVDRFSCFQKRAPTNGSSVISTRGTPAAYAPAAPGFRSAQP